MYKINDNITLKLENDRTNIYINGEKFNHCKYLLMNLEAKKIPEYDDFESIDDVFEHYSRKNERSKFILEPKQEFIGHCSNLQVWVENDYNVNILHTSLSFPLLVRLSYLGDNKAKIALKEEIAIRLLSGNKNTVLYFLEEDYLFLFELEELEFLFKEIDISDDEISQKINDLIYEKKITNKMKVNELKLLFREVGIKNQKILKSINKLIYRKRIIKINY